MRDMLLARASGGALVSLQHRVASLVVLYHGLAPGLPSLVALEPATSESEPDAIS